MPETEKITINMAAVDLGKIDLLVQEGLYSNRTDFIRTALRGPLEKHSLEIQQSVTRHSYVVGVLTYNRADLERYQQKNERLQIAIIGLLHFQNDITPELAAEVVDSIQVRGIFLASDEVKAAIEGKME
jgi:Arc/MetJ-type ribon-helix-helix transcriptional regulator